MTVPTVHADDLLRLPSRPLGRDLPHTTGCSGE